MMMIYGMFVFELRTLPHQQLQQNKSWRARAGRGSFYDKD